MLTAYSWPPAAGHLLLAVCYWPPPTGRLLLPACHWPPTYGPHPAANQRRPANDRRSVASSRWRAAGTKQAANHSNDYAAGGMRVIIIPLNGVQWLGPMSFTFYDITDTTQLPDKGLLKMVQQISLIHVQTIRHQINREHACLCSIDGALESVGK